MLAQLLALCSSGERAQSEFDPATAEELPLSPQSVGHFAEYDVNPDATVSKRPKQAKRYSKLGDSSALP